MFCPSANVLLFCTIVFISIIVISSSCSSTLVVVVVVPDFGACELECSEQARSRLRGHDSPFFPPLIHCPIRRGPDVQMPPFYPIRTRSEISGLMLSLLIGSAADGGGSDDHVP